MSIVVQHDLARASLPRTALRAAETPAITTDPRAANAIPNAARFVGLLLQLVLLLGLFVVYRAEESGFLRLTTMSFAAFAVHYWLPFQWKATWWITASWIGAALLIGPQTAALLFAIGLLVYGLLASGLPYRWRLALTVALFVALGYARALSPASIPPQLWAPLGAIFMFRLMIYLYDLRFARGRPSFSEYCAYFFPLPAFYFFLFPVIDLQTLRHSYFRRDIHAVAQQGITWMLRGTVQLALYRIIYHLKTPFTQAEVTSFASLVTSTIGVYLLYLRVSGQFHVIVGILHLFGYDLPETHRKYLLASSLTDFWRRINIYWKDFMLKLVFFPVYFRLRRSGDVVAQVVATAAVFLVTWLLHSYQWFWLRGAWLFTWPDTLFWGILGLLVIANLMWEQHRRRRPKPQPSRVVRGLQIAGTFSLITLLWSLWNAPTVTDWLDILMWWS